MIALRLQSFGTKLLLLFVLVVAVAQFATYAIVSRANLANASEQIAQDLATAAGAFQRVVAERNELLAAGAAAAAGDYAYKPLFAAASPDAATLASALSSIRLRIGADTVMFLDLAGRRLAGTTPSEPAGGLLPQLAARADADPGPNPRATGYGYLDRTLYSLVTVPVRAPDVVGWLVVGFRIDHAFASRLKELTEIDVSFIDQDGRILASTLPRTAAAALADLSRRLGVTRAIVTVPLAGEAAMLTTRALAAGEGVSATLALQYSLEQKRRTARRTEQVMLYVACGSLALAALLAIGFARRLSRPVEALAAHTRLIAAGDYATRIQLHRTDELGRLAESFNAMTAGLAERDRVRDLLDKNVSPAVATRLLRDGTALGGEEREVTILFVDLRGFTSLSERLPPRDLIALLNRYLDRMSEEIERHGGVIDKFIGDAIMALFGAPVSQSDHADRALAAARAMESALAALNREFAAEGRPPLALGIGVNTARVIAGNIGSHRRLNYSVIGDGVNLAARFQSLTRTPEFRTNILVSAATLAACRGPRPPTRDLGLVTVKGRAEPVALHAVDV